MSFRIPNNFVAGFEILHELSIDDVNEIASIIHHVPPGIGPRSFNSFLKSKFDKIQVSELSSTIYSFGNLLLNSKKSKEEIAQGLSNSFFDEIDIENDNMLQDKILVILNSAENLKQTFKAIDLISDNDIIFSNGRIFSDIRLLFEESIDSYSTKRKAVIIHRLKLESNKNGDNKDYYFALDSSDLVKMKDLIDRAILKDSQIKNDYSNIEFLDITD